MDAKDVTEWLPEFMVSAENDRDLMQYFLATDEVHQLINSSKWMVVGRKGTGKTAIFEYLRNNSPSNLAGNHIIALNFQHYPWPIHRLYRESMEAELSAYQKSWKYLIITKALAQLIELREASSDLNAELRNAKKLFEELYGNPNPSIFDIIKAKLFRLKRLKAPNITADQLQMLDLGEVSFEEVNAKDELKEVLRYNSFQLLQYFDTVLKRALSSGTEKLMVVFDQLDEQWQSDELAGYSKILINLITASQEVNLSREYQGLLKVVIFLRTDIYETLNFNDKNKIFQDSAIQIRWNASSLDGMMLQRIKKYAPADVNLDFSLGANCVFHDQKLRHGADPFAHVVSRTFYRPRDVITFFNKIRGAHRYNNSDVLLYEKNDVYRAEPDYSQSLYNEITDEWGNQRPEIRDYMRILQLTKIQTFNFQEFKDSYMRQFSESTDVEVKECLWFFFENSIIGQKTGAIWEYKARNPHLQIDFSKSFKVNNGLKARLTLIEERKPRH